jgi:hypothetical protein
MSIFLVIFALSGKCRIEHGAWGMVFECKETASQALNARLHAPCSMPHAPCDNSCRIKLMFEYGRILN